MSTSPLGGFTLSGDIPDEPGSGPSPQAGGEGASHRRRAIAPIAASPHSAPHNPPELISHRPRTPVHPSHRRQHSWPPALERLG